MSDDQAGSFGPKFWLGVRETLADGTEVFNVTVRHFAAILPAEDDEDEPERPEPMARPVGAVWSTGLLGWAASPVFDGDGWPDLVQRAERSFPDREGAAMFLYGFDAAMRWQRAQEALAKLPWRKAHS